VLYGKWRPRSFGEVVGQDHIVLTLKNALATGQVAHAYLFTGPRGTGKTTTARLLAKAVNCEALKAGEPCNACAACDAINKGAALDLIELDAASNRGIDDVRELRDRIAYAPSDLQKKVYLLDEAHMMTGPAFNALLKTLEEPPPHAIFILATTELHQMPKTIVSRCQRFDFRRVENGATVARLKHICEQEGYILPPEALHIIAVHSRGGLRDAITLVEQVVAQCGASPSTNDVEAALGIVHDGRADRLAEALLEKDLPVALQIVRGVAEDGVDIARFSKNTVEVLRGQISELLEGKGDPRQAAEIMRRLSVAEALSAADYKRDPASPVPLEVACAAAILGHAVAGLPAAVAAPQAAGAAAAVQAGRRGPGQPAQRPARGGARGAEEVALSPEERFLRQLQDDCRALNTKVAAYLNGSCHVIALSDDQLELGFYHDFHMQQVEQDGRTLIEQQAERILERPVRLVLRKVERPAAQPRAPRGGHLVQAARSLEGATPVGKD
jgi:DNA polymerase-3 subunit gamma/tau